MRLGFRFEPPSCGVALNLTKPWGGAAEQRDVLGAVAYLERRGFAPARTGFWAHSMGAATVLLADHARRLAVAAGPAVHDLWIVPGARHDRVSATVPERYRTRVLAFFDEKLQ